MQSRVLGRSGITISEIGVGCWAIGGPDWNLQMPMGWGGVADEWSLSGLYRAYELGATYFDTADVYGHGHSERLLGKFLTTIQRDEVVIGTKVGYFRGCAAHAYDPIHMRHQLEMSLRNLGTDYIDIYYFHNLYFGDTDEYFTGAVEAMRRFQQEGKIRVIGQRGPHKYAPQRKLTTIDPVSEYERFLHVASIVRPEVVQIRYNMISPTFDTADADIFAWAETNAVGIVINKPLGQGLLLDKYDPNEPMLFEAGDHRSRKLWFRPEGLHILHERLSPIKQRFGGEIVDMIRVAIQYCLARSPMACVAVGFKNPEQVEMNLAATGAYLTADDVAFIRQTMEGVNAEVGSFFGDASHGQNQS